MKCQVLDQKKIKIPDRKQADNNLESLNINYGKARIEEGITAEV